MMLNCHDDLLLFLYKRVLLASETRSKSVQLPRQPEAGKILDDAGIAVVSAKNNQDLVQKLSEISGDINILILNHGKKAMLEQLYRHLRNAVAHADFRCNRKAGGSIEIFHEFRGTKRLYGSVQQQALRKLITVLEEK